MQLEGQVAVITGGARGIGRAIAETFLENGAEVAILDWDAEASSATVKELSTAGSIEAVELDVRNWGGVADAIATVAADRGRLDICVNNAGATAIGPSTDLTQEDWQRVVDINLSAVFSGAQAAGREMIARSGGSIINMASASVKLALVERAAYVATKGAVVALTKALAAEWAPHGIRVNAIGPGWVKTSFVQKAIDEGHLSEEGIRRRTPLDRLAEPREIAQAALYLASNASSYMTGQTIYPDGGFSSYGSWT